MKSKPCDINGRVIDLGTKVRILKIPEYLLNQLPSDEVLELKSMIGEVFVVNEIDEWGGV